jgi:hypothetical protein
MCSYLALIDLFSTAWMCRSTNKPSNIGWWLELLGFRRLEVPHLSELLDLQVMMHIAYLMHCTNIWCIIQIWFRFCPRPHHRAISSSLSMIEVHPSSSDLNVLGSDFHLWWIVKIWHSVGNLSFLRTIVSYVTYVSPISNWHGSHALRMWVVLV